MNFLISSREFKNHIFKKENIFFFTLIISIFFFDRLLESRIINSLEEAPYYVNDYVNFELIWNIGIGFGLLSTNSTLFYNFITTVIAVIIIFLIYFLIISDRIDKFIYSIILGGALGNFYDRLIYKAVPDFIDLHYGDFHWFTFNIADIFISLGILIYLLKDLVFKK